MSNLFAPSNQKHGDTTISCTFPHYKIPAPGKNPGYTLLYTKTPLIWSAQDLKTGIWTKRY